MAQRRMFSLQIVDSDAFLDMPVSAQALYFHLGMRADDDGFVSNTKKISRVINAGDDDLKILAAKRFVIVFNSGIVVIKHWKMNNYIPNDRYMATQYIQEKNQLYINENGSYTDRIQSGDTGKVRLGKVKNDDVRTREGSALNTQEVQADPQTRESIEKLRSNLKSKMII